MALLASLLGAREIDVPVGVADSKVEYPVYSRESGPLCPNPRCVSVQKTEIKYIKPEYRIVNTDPLTLRCVYCEHGFEPKFVASSDWHEGRLDSRKYHGADSHWVKTIRPENLIFFNTEEDAMAQGFKPSYYTGGHH